MPKTITSITTGTPIAYSFRVLTYRQFQGAIDKLDEARQISDRKERNRLNEEVANELIENATQLLNEATNVDVQQAMVDAIDFNQGTTVDVKKSE